MSYKITRGRVPTGQSVTATKPRPDRPIRGYHRTASRCSKGIRKHPSRQRTKPHTPYSVCPPMNSLMIDVGGIAAISSGESATM